MCICIWLIVAPVEVEVDSEKELFMIRYRSIGRVYLETVNGHFVLRCRILLFRWEYDFNATGDEKIPRKQRIPAQHRSGTHKAPAIRMKKIIAVLRSTEIKKFHLDIDTDDHVRNAILFPAGYLLSTPHHGIEFNFNGKNSIQLLIIMVPVKILWTYFRN